MPSCCAVDCTNRQVKGNGLTFYRIPKGKGAFKQHRRRLWIRAIRREDWSEDLIDKARICSDHFISGRASEHFDSPDFVPSLFKYNTLKPDSEAETYNKTTKTPISLQKLDRFNRKKKRHSQAPPKAKRKVNVVTDVTNTTDENITESFAEIPQEEECATVPKIKFDELSTQYDNLHSDYVRLRMDYYEFKEQLERTRFGFKPIHTQANQFSFYTGLANLQVFHWLLWHLRSSVSTVYSRLSLEDHLLIVLMKLRLGITNKDISYRFQIPVCYVLRVLRNWLPIMSEVLKALIKWPSKQSIQNNMPKAFRHKFRKCRCIIDCTEIFIDRPTNLTSRAQTWSNYKHHNTIKYLVGIAPAGAISFISTGWGGKTSDKEIAKKSGFLDLLEPGDEILADRGFLVRDELAAYGASLKIPHFTKGKKQMSANEVDTSRQLSRVRIHVERVIGRWKNYKILTSVMPVAQADLLDEIVVVCAALTNLSASVVNKK